MRFIKRLILWVLIILRLPVTVYRMAVAYRYARYMDLRMSHDREVTLRLESGEAIRYIRGSGMTLFKFMGAFNDRR